MPARSRWLVGSSSSITSGSQTKASVIASRLRQPPLSAAASAVRSTKPARPESSRNRPSRSFSFTWAPDSARSKTCRMVSPGANRESCGTYAARARLRTASSPVSGSSCPARIASRVDLPAPFGPIRPILSPSFTVSEMFWKSGLAPNCLVTDCALRIGGICYKHTLPQVEQSRGLKRSYRPKEYVT